MFLKSVSSHSFLCPPLHRHALQSLNSQFACKIIACIVCMCFHEQEQMGAIQEIKQAFFHSLRSDMEKVNMFYLLKVVDLTNELSALFELLVKRNVSGWCFVLCIFVCLFVSFNDALAVCACSFAWLSVLFLLKVVDLTNELSALFELLW
jgi:hypothetical protein